MVNINELPIDENGLRHGECLLYYNHGGLDYRWNYIHGVAHGFWESYYPDGTIYYRGYYNMGREIGFWIHDKQRSYSLWLI